MGPVRLRVFMAFFSFSLSSVGGLVGVFFFLRDSKAQKKMQNKLDLMTLNC